MGKKNGGPQANSSSTIGQAPVVAVWAPYVAAFVAAAAAFLLVGTVPFFGPTVARGVVAGCVAGLWISHDRDILPFMGIAAAAALLSSLALGTWLSALQVPTLGVGIVVVCTVVAPLAAAALGFLRARANSAWAASLAAVILGAVFLYSVGVLPGPQTANTAVLRAQLAVEPGAEQYGFDAQIFIKTSFLVDAGTPYYQAFFQAYDQDTRLTGNPPGLLNVRQPWLYYVWRVLPGASGTKIWDWYVVLGLGTLACVFWGLRDTLGDGVALAAASGVCGYMIYGAATMWFALSEYWAGCFAVCAVMAMLRKRTYVAAVLVVAAFAFREIAAWVIPVYVVWWLFTDAKRRTWPALLIATAGPVALFGAHWAMSPVKQQAGQSMGFWMQAGLENFLAALRFSGELVPGHMWLYPLLAAVAVAGTALFKDRAQRAAALAACVSSLGLLAFFSNGQWGYYWGAIGMPTVLALAFVALGPLTGVHPGKFLLYPSGASSKS